MDAAEQQIRKRWAEPTSDYFHDLYEHSREDMATVLRLLDAALADKARVEALVEHLEGIAEDIIGWKTTHESVGPSDELIEVTVRRGIIDKLAALDDGVFDSSDGTDPQKARED